MQRNQERIRNRQGSLLLVALGGTLLAAAVVSIHDFSFARLPAFVGVVKDPLTSNGSLKEERKRKQQRRRFLVDFDDFTPSWGARTNLNIVAPLPPTLPPTKEPTASPTNVPTTLQPTLKPTMAPSISPSLVETARPSSSPSDKPTKATGGYPEVSLLDWPTGRPTVPPSPVPPSVGASLEPSQDLPIVESLQPTLLPSVMPSLRPSYIPTEEPTLTYRAEPAEQAPTSPTAAPTPCFGNRTNVLEHFYVFFEEYNTSLASDQLLEHSFRWSYNNNSDLVECGATNLDVDRVPDPILEEESTEVDKKRIQTKQDDVYGQLLVLTERVEFSVTSVQINYTGLFPTPLMRGAFVGGLNQFFSMRQLPIYAIGVRDAPVPSAAPSSAPSDVPTEMPTLPPTDFQAMPKPTPAPTSQPTPGPTPEPTLEPTSKPSPAPTTTPSVAPTPMPSPAPTPTPSPAPTTKPSPAPTPSPSTRPSIPSSATSMPTASPSTNPLSPNPTIASDTPTAVQPTIPNSATEGPSSKSPTGSVPRFTGYPTVTASPSSNPPAFGQPSLNPLSGAPSAASSSSPGQPSLASPTTTPPGTSPSKTPTAAPNSPSGGQTEIPSSSSTSLPSDKPSVIPSALPTGLPSVQPSGVPTIKPTIKPTESTYAPTANPSLIPEGGLPSAPSPAPASIISPSSVSDKDSTDIASSFPTRSPAAQPTGRPSTISAPGPGSEPSVSTVPNMSPTPLPSPKPDLKLREPELKGVRMTLTGASLLPSRSQLVWTDVTETAIHDEVITILNNQVESVDVKVEIVSQNPKQASSRSLQEPSADPTGTISSNLTIVFDVTFFIRAIIEDHNLRRYVGAALDTSGDQDVFLMQLKSSGEAAFQNLTSIRLILPPDVSSATEEGQEQLSAGMSIGIAAVSVAGVALLIVGVYMWVKRQPARSLTASSEQYIGNLQDYDDNDLTFDIMEKPETDVSTLGDPIPQGAAAPMDVSLAEETTSLPYDYKVASHALPSLDETNSYAFSEVSSNAIDMQTDDDTLDAQYFIEDRIEVDAPPGLLGLVLEEDSEGIASVYDMKELSPLADRVQIGDKLLSVDSVDVTAMPVQTVMNLIASKQAKNVRKLVFSRPTKKNGHC